MLRRYSLALLALLAACTGTRPTTRFDTYKARAELPMEEAIHPRNSLEWWYLTGHLRDADTGEQFGVEYVFFHFNPNGKRDYQMVNFALSDPQGQQFVYDYKVRRLPALLTATLPVALHETAGRHTWTLSGQEGRYHLQARMSAHAGQAIDLTTTPLKPVLLHGGTGYEHYSATQQAGYYSYPRLAATGTIEVAGKPHRVTGELWYDRQWNCGGAGGTNVAWDWMSLQLHETSDDLMLYQVRDKNTGQTLGGGSRFGAQGENLHLAQQDFTLEPLTYWTSPASGRRYPATWRVQVPAQGYDLTVTPLLPQQELDIRLLRVVHLYYWEGMCKVTGTHHGQPVTGNAYVEITNRGASKKGRKEVAPGTAAVN